MSALYPVFKKLAFCFDPEWVHERTLHMLAATTRPGKTHWMVGDLPQKPVTCMGLSFQNPIGLAAGMDKNGACVDGFASLGFGFVEVGTVTPRPQPGNPKPRLFRLPEHEAIINRMGFNNHGVEALLRNLASVQFTGPLGINIGKNADTPLENAASDYRMGMEAVYSRADYIAVNISSPNTKDLRELQKGDAFGALLQELSTTRNRLAEEQGIRKPVAVKIAPDMDTDQIRFMADALVEADMDAVIATNTTLDRTAVAGHIRAEEAGGLSGAPVREPSTEVIATLSSHLNGRLPIIGVGGIFTADHAREKLDAGATLLQVYTGLIYQGPGLVSDLLKGM